MSASALNTWVAVALALIVLVASVRQLRRPAAHRGRQIAVIALQVLAAALLYACLLPPTQRVPMRGLVVIGADAGSAGALPTGGTHVVLPEADDVAGAARVPDLATALRLHPSSRMTLVGAGLAARDRDTVLPADTRWQAAPAPTGWVSLQPPADTSPGARFELQARAHGVAAARAELLDPAGAVVDRVALPADGRVQLSGVARAEGRSVFQLRLLDAQGHVADTVPVPQQTLAAAPLRLLVRAGAPGAELKYLRRWATDAGIQVQVQADVGAGVSLGDGSVALDAATLARSDVLLLDERSLAALGAAQLAAVRAALRDGLGVLVRSTGAPSASARQRLGELGLPVRGDAASQSATLPGDGDATMRQARRGPVAAGTLPTRDGEEADRESHTAALPVLESLALHVPGSHALLQDHQGKAIGGWLAVGKGRIGMLPITDSWRWVLAGRDDRHGEVWSTVMATLARAQAGSESLWSPQALAWTGERQPLCGVQAPLQSLTREGVAVPLRVDPATGDARCAGWWPRQPGWQRLQHGDRTHWRYVFDPDQARALHRQAVMDATAHRLATTEPTPLQASQRVPGPRWPWWLAFVACTSLLWWLERRPAPSA